MKALILLALASLLPAQGPDEVVATYQLDGKTMPITRTDVAIEMAFHLRRRERGSQAADQLVASTLIRNAAEKKHLMPTDAEVRAFWADLKQQMRAAGHDPATFAAVRNTSERQLLDDVALQMAQERLVRAELGLGSKEKVSGDMMQLWLQEEKKRAAPVSDADQLPGGVAVRVGDTNVPMLDLGMLLLRTSEDDERNQIVRQVAYESTLEAVARKEGIEVTAADLDESMQKKRDDTARDPRFRGVTFESLLKTGTGHTVQSLRDSRLFRAQVVLDKLSARRFPDSALAAEVANDRAKVLDLVGPRRHVAIVFLRALATPNAIVTRDFDAAMKHLDDLRALIAKESFEKVARLESEHAESRANGGDAGWHRRRSDKLPEPVLAAAFALPAGDVSMPIKTDEGAFLVKCIEIDPVPSDGTLLQRLREYRTKELSEQLLAGAKVDIAGAKTAGGSR